MSLPFTEYPGRGSYLLLVHGMLSSQAQWSLNVAALADVCRPVTVSLLGHSGAPAPEQEDCYRPEGYIDAFEEIRQQLGTERWFVCGYSLGAALTLRYAIHLPQVIVGHIFTNSASAFADSQQTTLWQNGSRRAASGIREQGMQAVNRIAVHPRHAKRLPACVKSALVKDAERHDPIGVANTMLWTTPHASVRSIVATNRRPALLVCGTHEKRFQAHRTFAAAHMPSLQIADVDAGHAVNMQAADEFNHAVRGFIRQHVSH